MKLFIILFSLILGFASTGLSQSNDSNDDKAKAGSEATAAATGADCKDGTCLQHTLKDCSRNLEGRGCPANTGNAKTGIQPTTKPGSNTPSNKSEQ